MLDWLAALPPLGFVAVLALGAGVLALLIVRLGAGAGRPAPRPALPAKPVASRAADEPPHAAADRQRLVATLRALDVREPGRRAIRDDLLATLVAQAPGLPSRR